MKRQKSFENNEVTLYLVATPIGNLNEMTPRAIEILNTVDIIAAEDTRNTLKLLGHFDIHTHCIAHHMHNELESANGLIKLLDEGKNVAVVSDAGYPLISDPGATIAKLVIEAGYNVVPISGPSAFLNAIVASGINVQPFLFHGFLGNNDKERNANLIRYRSYKETLIFYEAPHRIMKTLAAMLEILGDRNITLARELTKKHEEFIRGNISEILLIQDELKGEMVIVVEGNKEETIQISNEDIISSVNDYIKQGLHTNDAIKKVAKENGIAKNEVYNTYHNLC
ncbi:MAG: 16S rRNA (cytidine(1402)-2'-O)-methyltransferase [Erysipelotrichaceae bacterium]